MQTPGQLASPPVSLRDRLRKRLGNATLATKLMLATGLVIIPALVATVSLLGYASYRDQLASFEADLEIQARVAAENVSAAILFDSRPEAAEILRSVFAPTSVVEAQVYNTRGERVAAYQPGSSEPLKLPAQFSALEKSAIPSGYTRHIETVGYRGQAIGSIAVLASLQPLNGRLFGQFQRAALILAVFGVLALLLARRFIPRVVAPASRLAALMDNITLNRDYSARAAIENGDEIGHLAERFNGLLAQIQNHEHELRRELAERQHTESRLAHLAVNDPVTGLNNRRYFYEHLRDCTDRTHGKNSRFAVMFIDLDNFKVVNDSLGHSAGDALLTHFGGRLKELLRATDIVCRVGGDEFAVILERPLSTSALEMVAAKIVAMTATPMVLEGNEVTVTASIGISVFPDSGQSAEELVRNADTAMYSAKKAGKNTYALFSPSMTEAAERRFRIEAGLRRAIERNELALVFQPIVDLQTHEVVKAEALLRWHSENGLVSPLEFISIAEDTGLITSIGDWVLQKACETLRDWRAQGLNLRMAVNVSGRQLTDPRFVETVIGMLQAYSLRPDALDIEITESVLVTAIEPARKALDKLEWHGIHLSIDDFGTGYSSLAYLSRLSVDGLKVDRSLIDDLAGNPENIAITTAIVGMAKGLGASVVAEGVETLRQADALRKLGCPYAQGYLFSPPIEASEMAAMVRNMPQSQKRPHGAEVIHLSAIRGAERGGEDKAG
jgi:diguanylate cyclase (GGDEF)-like protein